MANTRQREQGVMLVLFAILLPAVLGFAAMAIDVGYWYLLRAELSKSVDAAALAAAKNVGKTSILNSIVKEVGLENFSRSPLGSGLSPTFVGTQDAANQTYSVTGTVTAPRWFAYFMGPLTITKTAKVKMKRKEVVLVLDRSGSMSGTDMTNLKTAATGFVNNFVNTQQFDKLGLVTFSYMGRVDVPLATNSVSDLLSEINDMAAVGGTDAEDALDKARLQPFTDQTGVPAEQRIAQFVIFFTDGDPQQFSVNVRYLGQAYERLLTKPSGCSVYSSTNLLIHYREFSDNASAIHFRDTDGALLDETDAPPIHPYVYPTGPGDPAPSTCFQSLPIQVCTRFWSNGTCRTWSTVNSNVYSTRWDIFGHPDHGIFSTAYRSNIGELGSLTGSPYDCRNYSATASLNQLKFLPEYVCALFHNLPRSHAQEMKDSGIKIYSIGLGMSGAESLDFITDIASPDPTPGDGVNPYVFVPTTTELQGVFNRIARDIEVRLAE